MRIFLFTEGSQLLAIKKMGIPKPKENTFHGEHGQLKIVNTKDFHCWNIIKTWVPISERDV
jgi:hypothetical protein